MEVREQLLKGASQAAWSEGRPPRAPPPASALISHGEGESAGPAEQQQDRLAVATSSTLAGFLMQVSGLKENARLLSPAHADPGETAALLRGAAGVRPRSFALLRSDSFIWDPSVSRGLGSALGWTSSRRRWCSGSTRLLLR